jgi:hypothetical protein
LTQIKGRSQGGRVDGKLFRDESESAGSTSEREQFSGRENDCCGKCEAKGCMGEVRVELIEGVTSVEIAGGVSPEIVFGG